MDDVLTAAEVAEMLRIREASVWRLARAGRIPAAKVGGRWRFTRSQIEAYLQGEWKPKQAE